MEQRLSLITLGVSDVTRSRQFYEQLGWEGQEVAYNPGFALGDDGALTLPDFGEAS
jgi:hypothetical protein